MSQPGDMPVGPGTSVSPEARERAVEALTRGYAEDRLSEAELEASLDRVFRAVSEAELDALTARLPAAHTETDPGAASAVVRPDGRVPSASAFPRIAALFSGQERALTGVVPRTMSLRARLGYVELDLTRATFEPGLTEIDARALMGYVQIRLPVGVRVESDGHAIFGFFAVKGTETSGHSGDAPIVRITGRAILGFAECLTGLGSGQRAPSV